MFVFSLCFAFLLTKWCIFYYLLKRFYIQFVTLSQFKKQFFCEGITKQKTLVRNSVLQNPMPLLMGLTTGLEIRSFAHLPFAHLLISLKSNELLCAIQSERSRKWATVSKSLRSLISKEQPWANRSGRSWQISNHERFTQVAHQKRANEWFA